MPVRNLVGDFVTVALVCFLLIFGGLVVALIHCWRTALVVVATIPFIVLGTSRDMRARKWSCTSMHALLLVFARLWCFYLSSCEKGGGGGMRSFLGTIIWQLLGLSSQRDQSGLCRAVSSCAHPLTHRRISHRAAFVCHGQSRFGRGSAPRNICNSQFAAAFRAWPRADHARCFQIHSRSSSPEQWCTVPQGRPCGSLQRAVKILCVRPCLLRWISFSGRESVWLHRHACCSQCGSLLRNFLGSLCVAASAHWSCPCRRGPHSSSDKLSRGGHLVCRFLSIFCFGLLLEYRSLKNLHGCMIASAVERTALCPSASQATVFGKSTRSYLRSLLLPMRCRQPKSLPEPSRSAT
jgi:hypothetical protein